MTSRYNLWDEPWIKVKDENGQQRNISLTEMFQNAHRYQCLTGEMASQDFAIMRMCWAILETTFTRYRTDGMEQELQKKSLHATWQKIWQDGQFPMEAIRKYRDTWHDRFNLYDDKHPFYQITPQEINTVAQHMRSKKTGHVRTKLMDRLYSESNNKSSLSVPGKNITSDDALVRWLIHYQSYTSVGDKGKLPDQPKGTKSSRGWLFNLGSIYLRGKNLFETLALNLILDRPRSQHPIWEWPTNNKTNGYNASHPHDLADLYTNCSRLLAIDPKADLTKAEPNIQTVQLPKIDYADASLETMTLWGRDKKDNIYPKAHKPNRSLWHSFGLINNLPVWNGHGSRLPGIMQWYRSKILQKNVNKRMIGIVAVGMYTTTSDPSNSPHGEIYDELNLNNEALKDADTEKTQAIFNETRTTERAVWELERFGNALSQIRMDSPFNPNVKKDAPLTRNLVTQAYFHIDEPFKAWIAKMSNDTNTMDRKKDWHRCLRRILLSQADDAIHPLRSKDLQGIPNGKDSGMMNVATIYTKLKRNLNEIFQGRKIK